MDAMNESYSSAESLAKVNTGTIAKLEHPLTVGEFERLVLERYPQDDAEAWDRMGLVAGDPAALVSRVLIALDLTIDVIETAQQAGANVILTHHPVFLDPPQDFLPVSPSTDFSGTLIARALSEGISLINVHTALDCTPEVQQMLPTLLNLTTKGTLLPLSNKPGKGYGALCTIAGDESLRLDHLAARCVSVFGVIPRVWGSPNEKITNIAVVNGAAGSAVDACLSNRVDCLICGELSYHKALEANQKGLAIIELGHDISEIPLTAILAQAAIQLGVPPKNVLIYEQAPHWFTPDAVRA